MKSITRHPFYPWLAWALATAFFFSHYIVRVLPSILQEELMVTFAITATTSGLLGGLFYFPYIVMQMPFGSVVDKFGSRIPIAIAILICALSAYLFSTAIVVQQLFISRLLLGFCSAAAFLGAFKVATQWFPPHRLGLVVGVTQAMGFLGGAMGGPISNLSPNLGWRMLLTIMSILLVVLAVLILIFIRDRKSLDDSNAHPQSRSSFKTVFLHPLTWINALYAGFIFAPAQVLSEYWGASFIHGLHQVTKPQAAWSITLIFIGSVIGGPLAGALSDKIGRKPVMVGSAIAGLILLMLLLSHFEYSLSTIYAFTFLFGLTNVGLIASYTSAGEIHSPENAGLSLAIANMLSVTIGALMIPLCGWLMDMAYQGELLSDGTPLYTPENFQFAMSCLPASAVLALLLSFFMKETLKVK